ncbi:MAG TPA: bifunctional diaminohydroxyphosphoribosylaminopyrimidine deaminase/5-amino-6-(5-phosphoribosylamino)uracil reductase RibD [Syntrophales bacterium]|nr:bifunctional diaminohydroxyphosphoribosylaminopyrimidine deaminase/5-amino-6-(5-phosphoribosylamino)uracil reductase RibD [Syntrophales bacterium]HON99723.1 bifunctional diaminohydroxyphosphoribosylaminopyrimidine deaminase/5-amino-6-(5-phosphoribosylamino)uracil reductase RibD [Syntrophales bacterium]HPC01250.1 bifunctional diaminohydroxyphosphoribosylaminopyrimidine deaminase/5-amino-6-(5-phosphoribosylamino)uracil reductase RibD [Syntrophales bacterium]HRS87187.1 bifunctional diaminohydrox
MEGRIGLTQDERYMKRALTLARRGEGFVSPNPMVGAVIVKEGRVIGEGWHERCGGKHAEINALERARGDVAGSTIYVTLEPCCHHGRTPPCVDRIIAARPARVVVGVTDPNPLVSGRGIATLRDHGIETVVGVLEEACRDLNAFFFKYITTSIPFVTVKFAQTLDGRIATATGSSRWVSSHPSLRFAHRLRRNHDAILVGAGTVTNDDPELTVRLVRGRNPLRLVLDTLLTTPPEAKVFKDQEKARTVLIASETAPLSRRRLMEKKGIEILTPGTTTDGRLDLRGLLVILGERQITSLLVEGGSRVITSFIKERLADELIVVVAPKIVGRGIDAVGDLGITSMTEALFFPRRRLFRLGEDVVWRLRTGWNSRVGS